MFSKDFFSEYGIPVKIEGFGSLHATLPNPTLKRFSGRLCKEDKNPVNIVYIPHSYSPIVYGSTAAKSFEQSAKIRIVKANKNRIDSKEYEKYVGYMGREPSLLEDALVPISAFAVDRLFVCIVLSIFSLLFHGGWVAWIFIWGYYAYKNLKCE